MLEHAGQGELLGYAEIAVVHGHVRRGRLGDTQRDADDLGAARIEGGRLEIDADPFFVPRGGEQVVDKVVNDSPDPIRLGGVSEVLSEQIGKRTDLETRATILGHVQRGGTPCAADRGRAPELRGAAARLLSEGQLDRLVVLQSGRITDVAIEDVADQQRLVPLDHPLIQAARSIGNCMGD